MKAFLLGVAFAIGTAVLAGLAMPGFFARPADEAFSTPSARVGTESTSSIGTRNFSGEPGR